MVSLYEFLSCDYNLANNRQVRMLANYNILGCDALKCWTRSVTCSKELKNYYEQKLLQSAKHTLVGLSFFGLTEYPKLSEYLFLKTFKEDKFKFIEPIKEINQTIADIVLKHEAEKYMNKIIENNRLDIELYDFAKELFFNRVNFYRNIEKKEKN